MLRPFRPDSRDLEDEARWADYVGKIARAQPGLLAFLRTLLPRATDADDVLQETNMVLWRKREESDTGREFGPWARRIAYFQTLAFLKKRTRARESRLSDEMLERLASESEERSDALEDRLRALRSCLTKMSEEDRALVEARYGAGGSVKVIAEGIQRSADALSMHLYRLRKKLAEFSKIVIEEFEKDPGEIDGAMKRAEARI